MMRYVPGLWLFAACASAVPPPEATSLLAQPLVAPEVTGERLERYTARLADARAAYEAHPDNADSIIWLGRRTAYLGRYRAALDIFTEGIEKHPTDARMYRHRGHRYITTRQLHRAISDFERAVELVAGQDDQVEPDGLPNPRGIPTSTLHSNIWYHLGLSYYVTQQYEKALAAYEACQTVSTNDDMRVATTYWHVMTLVRLGRRDDADALLATIDAELDLIENGSYHKLLLLFKGELAPDDVVDSGGDADVALANATVGYGIGFWHELNDRPDEALATWARTLEGSQWAGFGYLASEAEVAHR